MKKYLLVFALLVGFVGVSMAQSHHPVKRHHHRHHRPAHHPGHR